MFLSSTADSILKNWARPSKPVRERFWPAFQVFGYTGVALAIMLAMTIIAHGGLSYRVMIGITGTAVATFLALVMATKIITGEERITYYHHEIAVIFTTT